MPINNPKEVLALVERAASDKISLPVRKILILAFLAGAYISMGGLFSIVIGYGFPSMAPAPGLQRLLSGLVFPLGLMLVVFAGAELFTGNNAVLVPGALGRRYGWRKVLLNWMLVYVGNFVGSLFFACFLVKLPGMLSAEAWRSAAVGVAEAKGLDAVAHGVPAGCRRQLAGVPGRVAGFERQRCRGPAAGIVLPDNVFCGNRL